MKTPPLFVAAGAETDLESSVSLPAPARPVNSDRSGHPPPVA